jgi:hypothetical protein
VNNLQKLLRLADLIEDRDDLDQDSSSPSFSPALAFSGRHCVVRTFSAGVHLGVVESVDGRAVLLRDSRRLWKWGGAFTLSEVALHGIDPDKSRISVESPVIMLTEAIELIPTSEKARETFDACHE